MSARVWPIAAYDLVFDGDSFPAGFGASTGYPTLVPYVSRRINAAVSGQRIDEMSARFAAQVAPYYAGQLIVEGGYNDLIQSDPGGLNYQPTHGLDATGTFGRLTSYVATARAAGYTRIIGTTLLTVAPATTYYTAYLVAQIAALNALILASSLYDVLADLSALTVARQSDGLHPSDAGHATIAAALASAVRRP